MSINTIVALPAVNVVEQKIETKAIVYFVKYNNVKYSVTHVYSDKCPNNVWFAHLKNEETGEEVNDPELYEVIDLMIQTI